MYIITLSSVWYISCISLDNCIVVHKYVAVYFLDWTVVNWAIIHKSLRTLETCQLTGQSIHHMHGRTFFLSCHLNVLLCCVTLNVFSFGFIFSFVSGIIYRHSLLTVNKLFLHKYSEESIYVGYYLTELWSEFKVPHILDHNVCDILTADVCLWCSTWWMADSCTIRVILVVVTCRKWDVGWLTPCNITSRHDVTCRKPTWWA